MTRRGTTKLLLLSRDRVRLLAWLVAAAPWFAAAPARAQAPTVIWQASGLKTGYPNAVFTVDGTAVLLSKPAGFELRRASDGALLSTLTLPSASRAYDAVALSPDKTTIALSLFVNAVGTIELWRLSNGTLIRTITTDAVRSMKGIAYSSTGLVATRERFAYGGGGALRIFRAADGALVKKIAPVARNSAPNGLGFSPDGSYLAVEDSSILQGLWILRTSDWGAARSLPGAGYLAWAVGGASLWVSGAAYQQLRVSDGAVLKDVAIGSFGVTAATPDDRFLLVWDFVNGGASDSVRFLRTTDGGNQTAYRPVPGTPTWSNGVNAQQALFTYETCPSDCIVYVAKMPAI